MHTFRFVALAITIAALPALAQAQYRPVSHFGARERPDTIQEVAAKRCPAQRAGIATLGTATGAVGGWFYFMFGPGLGIMASDQGSEFRRGRNTFMAAGAAVGAVIGLATAAKHDCNSIYTRRHAEPQTPVFPPPRPTSPWLDPSKKLGAQGGPS